MSNIVKMFHTVLLNLYNGYYSRVVYSEFLAYRTTHPEIVHPLLCMSNKWSRSIRESNVNGFISLN